MRGDQLIRQWKIVSLLSGRVGRSLDQLKAELGVTKRTIQRDIAVLEATGFPVVSEAREGTVYWRMLDMTKEPLELSLTVAELMALFFSRNLLKVLQGSPMQAALESALEKIGARLPASGHDLLRRLQQQTAVSVTGWKDYRQSSAVIEVLQRCIRHRFTLRVVHRRVSAEEAKTRTVDPYRLWYAGGALYLVGYDHEKQAMRTFAVERIREATKMHQRFTVRDDFDFEAYTRTAFPVHGGKPQRVRIRFTAEQAPYVMERHWHDSQRFAAQEDGGVMLELLVGNLWEVKRWVMGWGADAAVVEPVELREMISQECERMLLGSGCDE